MNRAFTLIELLIVVAIIVILATVVLFVINPAELLKQSRDSTRIADIDSLSKSIGLLLADKENLSLGTTNTVYLSLPDTSSTCGSFSLPSLPSGWNYHCVTSANVKNTDGTGWIPVDFTSFSAGTPIAELPTDPVNNSTHYFSYIPGGSYDLSATLESTKYLQSTASQDNGVDPNRYEQGSDLSLLATAEGLVGYWPLDEGSGTTAYDQSGNAHNGTLVNSPIWETDIACVHGNCIEDASSTGNYIYVLNFDYNVLRSGHEDAAWTLAIWAKQTGGNKNEATILGRQGCNGGLYTWNGGYAFAIKTNNCWTGAQTIPDTPNNMNVWHYLVGVYNNRNMSFYVDGSIVGTATFADTMNSYGQTLGIGSTGSGGTYTFSGMIDNARVYDRALSASDVAALYNAEKP